MSSRDNQGDNNPGLAATDVTERYDTPPTCKATDVELKAVVPPSRLHVSQHENCNVKLVGPPHFLSLNLFSTLLIYSFN